MSRTKRNFLLRANALFLIIASVGAMATMDLPLIISSAGPAARVVGDEPYVGIGFVEAHGLALILGVLLWLGAPERKSHFTATAIHVLLGGSNLLCWQMFLATDTLAMGYITTALHCVFATMQAIAAFTSDTPPVSSLSVIHSA